MHYSGTEQPTEELMMLAVCEAARRLMRYDPGAFELLGKPNRERLLAEFRKANGIAWILERDDSRADFRKLVVAAQALQHLADDAKASLIIEQGLDEAETRSGPMN